MNLQFSFNKFKIYMKTLQAVLQCRWSFHSGSYNSVLISNQLIGAFLIGFGQKHIHNYIHLQLKGSRATSTTLYFEGVTTNSGHNQESPDMSLSSLLYIYRERERHTHTLTCMLFVTLGYSKYVFQLLTIERIIQEISSSKLQRKVSQCPRHWFRN